jgi:hypothetical protein
MKKYGLYESASVKVQTFKTAIEVSAFSLPSLLLLGLGAVLFLRACRVRAAIEAVRIRQYDAYQIGR